MYSPFYLFISLLVFLCPFFANAKDPALSFHVQKTNVSLYKNHTGKERVHVEIDVLKPEGIQILTTVPFQYDPKLRTLEIKEAYVLQPNGLKINLSEENIFTRPSAESQAAPGFSKTLTTTLVFPQITVGSRVVFTIEYKVQSFGPWGFMVDLTPNFPFPTKLLEISIEAPLEKDFFLNVAQVKGFPFKDVEDLSSQKRHITARLENVPAYEIEPNMVSSEDLTPHFIATTLPDWESCGRIYAQNAQEDSPLPDDIKNLSKKIVGSSTGLEAVKKIYNWVAQNITYISIYLTPESPTVPHSLREILKNNYGDCKDKAALFQALLKVQGIEAYVTLINANPITTPPPLPLASYFNHVIVYLPAFDIYADPTGRFESLGVLHPVLYDKLVVLSIPKGENSPKAQGKVAHIPALNPQENFYAATSEMTVSNTGTFEGSTHITAKGPSASELRAFFFNPIYNPETLATSILQLTPEGGAGSIEAKDVLNLDQDFEATGTWVIPRSNSTSEETFFQIPYGTDPRLTLPFMRGLFTLHPRKYPLEVVSGTNQWSYTIFLENGLEAFRVPFPKHIENSAGSYESTYKVQGNSIHVLRTFKLNKSVYPVQDQKDLMILIETLLLDLQQVIGLQK